MKISSEVMSRFGYLPKGVYERVIARVAAWKEGKGDGVVLSQDASLFYLGGQRFRILLDKKLKVLQVDIGNGNLDFLCQRLIRLVGQVLCAMMKSLHVSAWKTSADSEDFEVCEGDIPSDPLAVLKVEVESFMADHGYMDPREILVAFVTSTNTLSVKRSRGACQRVISQWEEVVAEHDAVIQKIQLGALAKENPAFKIFNRDFDSEFVDGHAESPSTQSIRPPTPVQAGSCQRVLELLLGSGLGLGVAQRYKGTWV